MLLMKPVELVVSSEGKVTVSIRSASRSFNIFNAFLFVAGYK